MNEMSGRQIEGADDDFTVLWKKVFTEEQLRDARNRLPFTVTLQALEDVLTSLHVDTGGQLSFSADVGFSRTRFTLETSTGRKGIDITIADGIPGVKGWAYYHCPTFQQREAWRTLGNKWIKRLIDNELDNKAAELLIHEQGRDAFEDTELTFSMDGQQLEHFILNIVGRNAERFRQAVDAVVNAYSAITNVSNGAAAEITSAPISDRRGGRPRDPDNEWAYQQVREEGRQPNDVYPEWLKRIGDKAKILDDPRDSFNKAIRPNKRK